MTKSRNLHLSTVACQMRLVRAAKASSHAKFYNLSTGLIAVSCLPEYFYAYDEINLT